MNGLESCSGKEVTSASGARLRVIHLAFTVNSLLTSIAFIVYSIFWINRNSVCGAGGSTTSYIAAISAFVYGAACTASFVAYFFRNPRVQSRTLACLAVTTFLFSLTVVLIMLFSLIAVFEPSCLSNSNKINFVYVWVVAATAFLTNSLVLVAVIVWMHKSSVTRPVEEANDSNQSYLNGLPNYKTVIAQPPSKTKDPTDLNV